MGSECGAQLEAMLTEEQLTSSGGSRVLCEATPPLPHDCHHHQHHHLPPPLPPPSLLQAPLPPPSPAPNHCHRHHFPSTTFVSATTFPTTTLRKQLPHSQHLAPSTPIVTSPRQKGLRVVCVQCVGCPLDNGSNSAHERFWVAEVKPLSGMTTAATARHQPLPALRIRTLYTTPLRYTAR